MEKFKSCLKQYIKKYYIVYLIIIVTLTIDLVTKAIFTDQNINVIPNILSFTYTENTGGAFSMLSNSTWLLILISLVFIILIVMSEKFYKNDSKLFLIAYSLILSGAFGNLIDRIMFNYVRDFIKLDFLDFTKINTIFNVADICVTIGISIMFIHFIISLVKEKKIEK